MGFLKIANVFTWFLIGGLTVLCAQETGNAFIHNYKPREYQASSANYVAVQDHRGVMYFGNFRGILEYDGFTWRLINLPNNSAVRSLAVDSTGTVYVGAPGELGYLQPDSMGRMQYQSFRSRLSGNYQDMVQVIGLDTGAIFRTFSMGEMYVARPDSFQTFQVPETRKRGGFFSFSGKVLSINAEGLCQWNGQSFVSIPGGESLAGKALMAFTQITPAKAVFHVQREGFWQMEWKEGSIVLQKFTFPDAPQLEAALVSSLLSLKGKLIVSTVKEGVYLLDQDGTILQHIDEGRGLQDNLVMNTFLDQHNSLWLCLSQGISRLEMDNPIDHWDEALGLEGIVFSVYRHQNKLYAATTLGVFRLDQNRFVPIPGVGAESWAFFPVQDRRGQDRLFVSSVRGLFEIRNNQATRVSLQGPLTNLFASRQNPNHLYSLSLRGGLRKLVWQNDQWEIVSTPPSLQDRYRLIEEDEAGNLWLSPAFAEEILYRVRPNQQIDTFQLAPSVQTLFMLQGELVFSTTAGLYRFDEADQRFIEDRSLPFRDVGILNLETDQSGNIWMACYDGPRRWLEVAWKTENGYQRDSLLLKELDNIEVWGKLYPEANKAIWIGSSDGLYRYTMQDSLPLPAMTQPIIRKIITQGDSLLPFHQASQEEDLLKLCSDCNSLLFEVSAPFFIGSKELRYRYRLSSKHGEEWSNWMENNHKEFTSLPPGDYVFEVQARNQYGQESEITRLELDIHPPWYRTLWAFLSYGLLGICLVYGTVRYNTQRLHHQNENLERLIYERTAEIWEQHKLIVKKTVALKRQKAEVAEQHDLLGTKNEELKKALTQLKNAQSHLVESEKMASLGQLTAGIAHEINNPINYVKNSVSPLKKDFSEIRLLFRRIRSLHQNHNLPEAVSAIQSYAKEIDAEYLFEEMSLLLQGIEEGANRTANIVKGLKTFARTDQDAFRHVDLHESIESTLTILANRLKKRIKISKDFDQNLPVCECMPGKINQVFMNLISNSVYAIEKEPRSLEGEPSFVGELKIKTENLEGKKVRITLSDTGCGMDEKIKQRIFDPFFTTKPVGEGTGLGLSITFGIIEKHQGSIKVESTSGVGTTFVLELPLQQENVEEKGA